MQLTKDTEEERVMDSKSDNIKFTSYNDANKIVDNLFEPLRYRFQGNLETLMRGSGFTFDSVQFMYYKCHKLNFRAVILIQQFLLIFCILKRKKYARYISQKVIQVN